MSAVKRLKGVYGLTLACIDCPKGRCHNTFEFRIDLTQILGVVKMTLRREIPKSSGSSLKDRPVDCDSATFLHGIAVMTNCDINAHHAQKPDADVFAKSVDMG